MNSTNRHWTSLLLLRGYLYLPLTVIENQNLSHTVTKTSHWKAISLWIWEKTWYIFHVWKTISDRPLSKKTYSWKQRSWKFSQEHSLLAQPSINHGPGVCEWWGRGNFPGNPFWWHYCIWGFLAWVLEGLFQLYPDPHTQITALPWWQIELQAVYPGNCISTFEPHMRMHLLLKGTESFKCHSNFNGLVYLKSTRHLSKTIWLVMAELCKVDILWMQKLVL